MTNPTGFVPHPALAPCRRWTMARKAAVVEAIRRGEVTTAQAQAAHNLTDDELASWERRFSVHGHRGLSTLRLQELRA